MPSVLLISAPQAEILTQEKIDLANDALLPFGAESEPAILGEGEAARIDVRSGGRGEIEETIAAALSGAPVDVAVLTGPPAPRKLFIADMDSTIITCECIDELAAAIGVKDKVAEITERAMRGELEFEPALIERVALLKGLPRAKLQEVFDTSVRLTSGARTLVQTMSAAGAVTALISGGFTYFTERVAELAGFQNHQGNILQFSGDRLMGTVARPILGQDAKQEALLRLAIENSIDLSETLAVGDGANDLKMIGTAGLGVAFRAKPKVALAAPVRIQHGDLTALLYLQGYRKDQFVG